VALIASSADGSAFASDEGGAALSDKPESMRESVVPVSDPKPARIEFNPEFFSGPAADLSRFTQGNPVLPGSYRVDLHINDKSYGRADVVFKAQAGDDTATPCFTRAELEKLGIEVKPLGAALDADAGEAGRKQNEFAAAPGQCVPLSALVPGATALYQSGDQRLDLSIPQANLRKTARGYVDPSRWDDGVTAAMLDYNLNAYTSRNNGVDSNSAYAGLLSGVNLAGWRLRQRSSIDWQSQSGTRVKSLAAYAEHDITALKSQLVVGDSYTSGEIFDSFNVRGVQLSTDDRMLPDSLRGYAPVVRGIAESNARVTVRQNGNIIYQTTVAAGPFEINDIYGTGYGGDLQVTITEADGRERRFSVPFASVPQLLRQGVSRFNVTVGRLRDATTDSSPIVMQAMYQRGMNNLVTVYGGVQASNGYLAGLLGGALNTSYGAIALDATLAQTRLTDQDVQRGQSWRLSYSKLMTGTGTTVSMAAYRYSTSGFYNLQDAVYARSPVSQQSESYDFRMKSKLQVNVAQPIDSISSLYLSGSSQSYWGKDRKSDLQYQLGFNSAYKTFTYNLYAQRTKDRSGVVNNQFGVSISIPLGRTVNKKPVFDSVSAYAVRDEANGSTLQLQASGSAGDNSAITYGVNGSKNTANGSTQTVGGYASYRSPVGTYGGTVSAGSNTKQASLTASGAVVAHNGGITLGPPLYGSAFALVEAKGATGAKLVNGQGAIIDDNGYAIVPSLMPYRVNTVAIDPKGLSENVELKETSGEVVPRAGAALLLKIPTAVGRPLIVSIRDEHGKFLPMGGQLFDRKGNSLAAIGQGGIAFVRGLEGSGELQAKWGPGASEQCVLPYAAPAPVNVSEKNTGAIARLMLRCRPAADGK
jgi:outer membrane usher protein